MSTFCQAFDDVFVRYFHTRDHNIPQIIVLQCLKKLIGLFSFIRHLINMIVYWEQGFGIGVDHRQTQDPDPISIPSPI